LGALLEPLRCAKRERDLAMSIPRRPPAFALLRRGKQGDGSSLS
jgi:hypothetical protein